MLLIPLRAIGRIKYWEACRRRSAPQSANLARVVLIADARRIARGERRELARDSVAKIAFDVHSLVIADERMHMAARPPRPELFLVQLLNRFYTKEESDCMKFLLAL